ncbi:MAG: hypothetical protein EHM12_11095 [Dehalococcoidia bacterium]|nr:MAG: hypothetical protein EHM12_11095 [Dehalococcoidia bacterium]
MSNYVVVYLTRGQQTPEGSIKALADGGILCEVADDWNSIATLGDHLETDPAFPTYYAYRPAEDFDMEETTTSGVE